MAKKPEPVSGEVTNVPEEPIMGEVFEDIPDLATTEIIPINAPQTFNPIGGLTVDVAIDLYKETRKFISATMQKDIDYGIIPGTPKPTLYKPGAEKLLRFFRYDVLMEFDKEIEEWEVKVTETTFPLFYYRVACKLFFGSELVYVIHASANSWEDRYRWRWVQADKVPKTYDLSKLETTIGEETIFDFALKARKPEGQQYGHPQEYYDQWDQDIANGVATSVEKLINKRQQLIWVRGGASYRIPNTDIYSQVNTLQKMAEKRGLVAAALVGCSASEFFTQDVEDIGTSGARIEAANPIHFVPAVPVAKQELIDIGAKKGLTREDIGTAFRETGARFDLNKWVDMLNMLDEYASKKSGDPVYTNVL